MEGSIWQFYGNETLFNLQSLVRICLHENVVTTSFYNVTRQHLDYVHDVIFSCLMLVALIELPCIYYVTSAEALTTILVHGTTAECEGQLSVTFPCGVVPFLDRNTKIRPISTEKESK